MHFGQNDLLIAVNGTGPGDPDVYRRMHASSHVRRLYDAGAAQFRTHDYYQGPTMLGYETNGLAIQVGLSALRFLAKNRSSNASEHAPRIFLMGFSRGAAAVVQAARYLERHNALIHALLLFDAVDRSMTDPEVVPGNVLCCYHAVRAASAKSAEFFGTTARRYHPNLTEYHLRSFHGTHAALGGMKLTTTDEDGYIVEKANAGPVDGVADWIDDTVPEGIGADLREQRATRVTLAQQEAATSASFQWMQEKLAAARRMPPPIVVTGRRP